MADEITTTLGESAYVFDKKALQLAERFFTIEDTSLLKVGTFGYVTALYSHLMRDSTFHNNMLYNEFFLTGSKLNSTVYNWAKLLDYDVELAAPSQIPIAIKLSLPDLEKVATTSLISSSTLEYVFDRRKVFDVGGFNFLLPYDLRIAITRGTSGQFTVTAVYDFENYNFKPSLIKTPYLKTTIIVEQGVPHIIVAANIFQLTRKEWVFTMTSNDILDVGIIEQNYGSNIVSFRAQYNANKTNIDSYQSLETIFNEVSTPVGDTFAFYTYIGDDTLRVYFSNRPSDFRPAFNSKIRIETFTTDAELGNFNYSGTINIRDEGLDNVTYSCLPLASAATGGSSMQSFKEAKIALMRKLRTRNSITTSYDLETYFKQVRKELMTSTSDYAVVKVRDDFIRRQFSLFVLTRNSKNELVPTNTVDLQLTMDDIETNGFSLKPGTMVLYDRIERRYRLLNDDELPEPYLRSKDSYLYCIPFLINLDFKEFVKANIYLTSYDRTVDLTYDYLNINTPYEIVVNSFSIKRNPIYDLDTFAISTYLNTNTANMENVKVRAVIYKDAAPVGYADLDRIESTSEYSLAVNAPDEFNSDGSYIIRDTFRSIENGALIDTVALDGSYSLYIGLLVRDNSTQERVGVYGQMIDIDDYTLVANLKGNENLSFAENLNDVMYNNVKFDEASGMINLSAVPLVGALSYLNSEEHAIVMNDIQNSISVAKLVSKNLENNTSVNVKFFNTYGISRYFDIDTIDLRLDINISLVANANSRDLDTKIKQFISEYTEACNAKTDKRFSFSNLVKELENNFSEIRYIKFFNVNGGNVQTMSQIKHLDDTIDTLPIDYVPEYLTIRKNLPANSNDSWFDFSINITYE